MSWKSLTLLGLIVCLTIGLIIGNPFPSTGPELSAQSTVGQTDQDAIKQNAAGDMQVADGDQQTAAGDNQAADTDDDSSGGMSLDEIHADYKAKFMAYTKRYRAAPTTAEKRKVARTLPNVKPYWPRMIELVNENPGSEAGLKVVDWWYPRGGRKVGADIIAGLLVKNYSQKKSINEYIRIVADHLPQDKAEKALSSIVETNSFDTVKASATYHLHRVLGERAKELQGEAAESVMKEMVSLSDSIFAQYPDEADSQGAKYSDLLRAVGFASNLEIGKPVPDIEGVDLQGVDFKLSDYKGKVVVISFWGDW